MIYQMSKYLLLRIYNAPTHYMAKQSIAWKYTYLICP